MKKTKDPNDKPTPDEEPKTRETRPDAMVGVILGLLSEEGRRIAKHNSERLARMIERGIPPSRRVRLDMRVRGTTRGFTEDTAHSLAVFQWDDEDDPGMSDEELVIYALMQLAPRIGGINRMLMDIPGEKVNVPDDWFKP
jgi:hypothetical protein